MNVTQTALNAEEQGVLDVLSSEGKGTARSTNHGAIAAEYYERSEGLDADSISDEQYDAFETAIEAVKAQGLVVETEVWDRKTYALSPKGRELQFA